MKKTQCTPCSIDKPIILGCCHPGRHVLIESLVRGVEEKLGEKIEIVHIHSKDREFLTQTIPIEVVEPYIITQIERPFIPPPEKKLKGHERSYKYHP